VSEVAQGTTHRGLAHLEVGDARGARLGSEVHVERRNLGWLPIAERDAEVGRDRGNDVGRPRLRRSARQQRLADVVGLVDG
jgi:hypothetical protein